MDNYFMISEFAKLRGININSLRYYEKLDLLKPAYIEERTGYRYYSAEQLPLLNNIILCVQLGIPLKEMAEYIDEDGNLQAQKLLEQGQIVARQRIKEMENNLKYIEFSLKNIEERKDYAEREGLYYRKIEERKIIATEFCRGELEIKKIVSQIAEIYKTAQKKEYFPILPAGQILELTWDGKIDICFFLEVLNASEEDDTINVLPAGEYSCMQAELSSEVDFVQLIRKNWKTEEKIRIIIDNVMLEKYSFETRPSELQRLESYISHPRQSLAD